MKQITGSNDQQKKRTYVGTFSTLQVSEHDKCRTWTLISMLPDWVDMLAMLARVQDVLPPGVPHPVPAHRGATLPVQPL